MDRLIGAHQVLRAGERVDEVHVAGEIEFRRRAQRLQGGVPLSGVVRRELATLAAGCGVAFDL